MKRIIIILGIITLLSSCVSVKNADTIVFSKQGKTEYHIIVPNNATDNEMYAAQTLQEYIYKISGAKIPIVTKCRKSHRDEIHIGNTVLDSKREEQPNTISVRKNGNSLYFNCKDDKYTMYSVIDFMERYLGVRQFAQDCDYYPIDSNLSVQNFKPYTFTTPNSYRSVNSQFMRRNKDLKRWLRLQTTDDMFANGYFVHTILRLCEPSMYFDSHPEYFALLNGEYNRQQVCFSNEDVYNIVRENLSQSMLIQPDRLVWSVSQEDNDIYCRCDRCNAIIEKYDSPAAPIILFVNRLAKDFPDKIISTLAYRFSRKCPKNIDIEDNVQIMLCSIEVDRNKTIEQQGDNEGSFVYDFEEWGKITKNIFLWDYECDFDYYLSPFPNLHTLQPNIQFFVRNNAFQHFQQANCDIGHEFAELKNYLIAKLLWNPNVNADSIINEFCMNYYGAAGSYIKQYIDDIESTAISMCDSVGLDIYGSPIKLKNNLLAKQNINKWLELFESAENKVENDSIYLIRVRTAKLALQYAKMEIAKTNMYSSDGWFELIDDKWQVKKDMQQMLEDFHYITDLIGMWDMSEKGLSPEQYYSTTKRMIDSDLSSNLAFKKTVTMDIAPSGQYSSGDIQTLTDGVMGSDDYRMLWLGWWGDDVTLSVDLEDVFIDKTITISSLAKTSAWILHPVSVECLVSKDNIKWKSLGKIDGDGYNKNNPIVKDFTFTANELFRYIQFKVTATKKLPIWHHCYNDKSWIFLDEIIVK